MRTLYRPQAATDDRNEFIQVLEHALDELYDPHASLNINLSSSTRLIPTGLDIWAEWQGGRAVVTQLRPGSGAERAGLRVGMELVGMNGVAIGTAVRARLGQCQRRPDPAARNWALLAVLAGRHDTPRTIEVRLPSGDTSFRPDDSPIDSPALPGITSRSLGNEFGVIAVHNLGSTETIGLFDAALDNFRNSRGLILDLRDTPAGGTTTVATAIMGRFIDHAQAYQRVRPLHGRAWSARVRPRGPWTYRAPVVVLVSRWTGSMGEGMAIGLDGMHRAVIVGTPMAGLNGGVFTHHLPHGNFNFTVPGEALSHLDGTPRERFTPTVTVDLSTADRNSADPILDAGVVELTKLATGMRN